MERNARRESFFRHYIVTEGDASNVPVALKVQEYQRPARRRTNTSVQLCSFAAEALKSLSTDVRRAMKTVLPASFEDRDLWKAIVYLLFFFFSTCRDSNSHLALGWITKQSPRDVTSALCGIGIYHYYCKGPLCALWYFGGAIQIQSRLKGKAKDSESGRGEERREEKLRPFFSATALEYFPHRHIGCHRADL